MRITEPIRVEHQELLPKIEELRQTGDAIGNVPDSKLHELIDGNIHFLRHHLVPHAVAEDKVMYPAVAAIMGAPQATATMSHDHTAVVALTERLEELHDSTDYNALRDVLYGLYNLVKVHFDKEEAIYLPLLDDNLTDHQATELFAAMGHSGHHGH
jgi:hemerythrin-like domain-containing protein